MVLFTLLSACSEPQSVMRPEYLGHWRGGDISLSIFADGSLAYKRNSKGVKTEINAPITEFSGNNIVVGMWFLTTTFVVSEPPHQVDGRWQMVVDGVLLTRSQSLPDQRPGSTRPKFTCSACSLFPAT